VLGNAIATWGVELPADELTKHTHIIDKIKVSGGITGGTVSGATTAGPAITITGSSTGTTAQPTTDIQPPQTGSVPTIPPYMKLYYIERTA
jgi:3-keto-L-gulonate-6-phosphate decarboxylase